MLNSQKQLGCRFSVRARETRHIVIPITDRPPRA